MSHGRKTMWKRLRSWGGVLLVLVVGIGILAIWVAIRAKYDVSKTLSRDQVDRLLRETVAAGLPDEATGVYGRDTSVFTRAIDIRLSCSHDCLDRFLAESMVLDDKLTKGKRAILESMGNEIWWEPQILRDVRGSEQRWSLPDGKADGLVMAGQEDSSELTTVYISITIER